MEQEERKKAAEIISTTYLVSVYNLFMHVVQNISRARGTPLDGLRAARSGLLAAGYLLTGIKHTPFLVHMVSSEFVDADT